MPEFSKENVRAALNQAPGPIQHAYGSQKTADTILGLQSKYRLHVDIAGMLSREIGYLLLGLTQPIQFIERIQAKGIDAFTAKSIAEDINREIFVPLQQKMREPTQNSDEDDDWEGFSASVPPEMYRTVSTPVEMPPPHVTVSAPPPHIPQNPVYAPEVVVPPMMHTMQTDMALQGAGHPVPDSAVSRAYIAAQSTMPASIPHPSQTSPARSFQTASVPYASIPYPSRPNIPVPPQPIQAPQTSSPNTPPPQNPITKEYSVDPYREPVE